MIEKIKKNENKIIFILIFLTSIIICHDFLTFHTVPDTYNVLIKKYDYYISFLRDGRLISSLYMLFGRTLNISIVTLDVISNILAIVFQSISVYILYKAIQQDKNQNVLVKLTILLGSYLIIFNPLSIEFLAYIECGVICFGKLLCVIAAKELVQNQKKILPLILIMISSICYQGILNVFIAITLLLLAIEKSYNKETIKKIIIMSIIAITAFFFVLITVRLSNFILGTEQQRINENIININQIFTILELTLFIVFSLPWNLCQEYFIIIVIAITLIIFMIFKKEKEAAKYLIISLLIALSCTLPLIFQSELAIEARTVSSIASIIGISIIMLENSILNDKNNKYKLITVIIFAISVFSINTFNYINNGIMLKTSNIDEKEYMENIANEIIKYENINNIKVTKISIYFDRNSQMTFNNFKNNTFTIKSLYTKYAAVDCLTYYLNTKFRLVENNKEYSKHFAEHDWSQFSDDQLIFDKDTLNLCIY